MKNKPFKLSFFVPVLFKFRNDDVVFSSAVLEGLKETVSSLPFIKSYDESSNKIYPYIINNSTFAISDNSIKDLVINIRMYYYHHRIIFFYEFKAKTKMDASHIRSLRKSVINHYKTIMNQMIEPLNACMDLPIFSEEDKSHIVLYYGYPTLFQKYEKNQFKFSSAMIETLFFMIYMPNRNPFSYGDKTYIRISIPSYTIYTKKEVFYHDSLVMTVINAIYQITLYQKKSNDKEITKDIESFDIDTNETFNRMDEKLLKEMWQYSIDNMAGRISDQLQQNTSKVMYITSILAFILSIIALILSMI